MQKLGGAIELRQVTFGYAQLAPPVIEDFNLQVLPGQWVAIVGASGCGKSTIAKLISGLHQPWSGEILFDGKPRHALRREVPVSYTHPDVYKRQGKTTAVRDFLEHQLEDDPEIYWFVAQDEEPGAAWKRLGHALGQIDPTCGPVSYTHLYKA